MWRQVIITVNSLLLSVRAKWSSCWMEPHVGSERLVVWWKSVLPWLETIKNSNQNSRAVIIFLLHFLILPSIILRSHYVNLVSDIFVVVKSPCAKNRSGINSTCDELVQGTNGRWLRPLTKSEFCSLFASCFHLETLRKRCESTFTLYYNYFQHHVFPLENGTTHFQITYEKQCDIKPSIFFTNVIRCNTIAKSSESGK